MRRRLLFVARGHTSLPLAPWLLKRWDALSQEFDVRVVNAGNGAGDERFRLLPVPSTAFYPRLPFALAHELRTFRPDAVVASDPFVGASALVGRALARVPAKVIVELHGDPRTFTRSYGSSKRRWVARAADAVARFAIARADSTRAVSGFTSSLAEEIRGVPATATFLAYSDLSVFADTPTAPVPEERRLVFVGALELYKNVDGLADAWRVVAPRFPAAVLSIVGSGSRLHVVERLVADLPGQVVHHPRLEPAEVAAEMDAARALVLPSWPEGLGRVVLEAFARGRPVIGTNGGGIPDIVTDGADGLLIPRADTPALAAAMTRVLEDRELCERLGAAARRTYGVWHQTPEDLVRNYADLVERTLAGAR
ncbi:MAG TPA: glycosyltransferase family 4 protein [Gaiellaceae bacterium]|nr:glycosyltransferase family 4 protein [Gaiellaceae bacterium]